MEQLKKVVDERDYQWACQLADHVMVGDSQFTEEARRIKIVALRGLAQQQINAPAMNYYLSYANELEAEAQDAALET